MCGTGNFIEEFNVDAAAYFGLKDSYAAEVYDIKFRYVFDYHDYPAAGRASGDMIYSPFSNIISKSMPAYSNASNWAKTELDKAAEFGLIPDSLKGADMVKNITREEFAEVALKLYEKTTKTAAVPISPNPFSDTTNPEILKAFKLGITNGTSAVKFSPRENISREQVATMLSRTIRLMVKDGDFSTAGAPVFTDQRDISTWAVEHVLFMSKTGIIKGTDGKFMPRAITTAQIAAGYANTTREQAIAMSIRSYVKYKDANIAPTSDNTPNQSEEPKTIATATNGMPSPSGGGISGVWMGYYVPYGQYSPAEHYLIMYEDGTFFHEIPLGGLDSFDRAGSQKDENPAKTVWSSRIFQFIRSFYAQFIYFFRLLV